MNTTSRTNSSTLEYKHVCEPVPTRSCAGQPALIRGRFQTTKIFVGEEGEEEEAGDDEQSRMENRVRRTEWEWRAILRFRRSNKEATNEVARGVTENGGGVESIAMKGGRKGGIRALSRRSEIR